MLNWQHSQLNCSLLCVVFIVKRKYQQFLIVATSKTIKYRPTKANHTSSVCCSNPVTTNLCRHHHRCMEREQVKNIINRCFKLDRTKPLNASITIICHRHKPSSAKFSNKETLAQQHLKKLSINLSDSYSDLSKILQQICSLQMVGT